MMEFIAGVTIGILFAILGDAMRWQKGFDMIQEMLINEEQMIYRLQQKLDERTDEQVATRILQQIAIHNRTAEVLKFILMKF